MDCDRIRPQLELFVLGGLDAPAEARVREHLAACPDCREIEQDYHLLVAEVRRTGARVRPRAALVRSLTQSAAREVRAERRRRWAWRVGAGAGAAAAAVLLAITIWRASPFVAGRAPASLPDVRVAAPLGEGSAAGEKWRHDGASAQPTSSADSVVVHGESMYFLGRDAGEGRVAAIDLATGRPRWESPLGSIGYLAADDSRVYCLAATGPREVELLAADAGSGAVQWRYAHGRSDPWVAPCRPVPVAGGRVAWVTHATVHLIDATTGRALWEQGVESGGAVSAVAADGGCLFAAGAASLHCLDPNSGRETWSLEVTPGPAGSRRPLLALADGRAYLAHVGRSGSGTLQCLDLRERRPLWHKPVGDVRHVLATGHGVYVRGADVRAYDARTGRPLWTHQAGGCSPMTARDGLMYLMDSRDGGRVLALHQQDGRTAWQMAGLRSCDAFRQVGQTAYVKTHDGIIHAIALRGAKRGGW
jgi:outer membrane protein assembly factor BamB